MTVEEFWDRYINDNILDIFDDTCNFFSHELPEGFIDEYDALEVILETAGHNESAKNFDKVIKFINIIQKHQPELYKEGFVYLNEFLVEYYCFHQNRSKVDVAFSLYIENPLEDYDYYRRAFKKIQFYQHTELLNRAIDENYHEISDSELIFGGPFDLAISRHFMILQEVYEKKRGSIDKIDLAAKLEEFHIDVGGDILSLVYESLTQSKLNLEDLKSRYIKDKGIGSIAFLRGHFLRYMYEKGFQFYLSGYIWGKMLQLWDDNKKNAKTLSSYFRVTADSFEKYLVGFTDIFMSNKPDMIATLWGSVYIYEFLHKSEIISTEIYQDFLKTSRKLKGLIIGIFTPDLWRSNFVHHWEKPDSVSETEFREEHNIFIKSVSFKHTNFSEIREYMSEELSKIGPLEYYIIKGGESRMKQKSFNLFDNLMSLEDNRSLKPVRVEKKVGRNDPCPCGSGKKYKKCCGKG